MDTKHRIMDEALTLWAQKGYANVYVSEIADKVGIKAPSLYKHYKNKQAIFDAIVDEMNKRYMEQAGMLNITGMNPSEDASTYMNISEEQLVQIGTGLFLYFLHDDYTRRFRKILTIEQFHMDEFAKLYSSQYVDGPVEYQRSLFQMMVANGNLVSSDIDAMTLQFYSPIYMLLTLCDREPDREEEAISLLKKHIEQFAKIYGGNK